MAKDKKQKAADKKARTAAKTEKKTKQKQKKAAKKPSKPGAADADSDAENVDLDAVLAEYAKAQEQYLKVTETVTDPPSARSSATLLASPSSDRELLLFGGEYFDGALARFYNDLFIYNTRRDEWRRVTSPNSPLPRSAHAWTRGGNAGAVWLFGGEFSSPKQGTFYHYADFWRLDPGPREWTKIEPRGRNSAPPARSGHRMTYFKQYIVLFGGFQDTSAATRYLADLWLYDTANFQWHQPALPPASPRPEPRSSFSFLPHEHGAVLAGGYSRVKTAADTKSSHKSKSGGGAGAHRAAVLKPLIHTDTWFLRITPPAADAAAGAPPSVRWERRKKPANAPAPPRAGATMAAHKGRGVLFGGVHDVEESDEGIESEFFADLFVWNVERNRFFSLGLRRPRANAARGTGRAGKGEGGGRRGGKARADEQELLARLKALEARDGGNDGAAAENEGEDGAADDESDSDSSEASGAEEKRVLWEMPHARFNAALAVVQDVLYVYGGTFEKGEREYTFDEMYAVDLGKLDGVRELFRREVADWAAEESEDDDEDDDEDDEGEDDEGSSDEEQGEGDEVPGPPPNPEASARPSSTATSDEPHPQTSPQSLDQSRLQPHLETPPQSLDQSQPQPQPQPQEDQQDPEEEQEEQEDTTPHPRPFESLRTFFARTTQSWTEIELSALQASGPLAAGAAGRTLKEVRARAFARAEARWWGVREEIGALEERSAEAGIGEVVSFEERGGAGASGGVGRRR